jgi:phosphatidylethanolamine-binding protein (PEBP) family uncharacterized protein
MQRSKSLVTILALVIGVGSLACSEDEPSGSAGTGGSRVSGAGGARSGGSGGSTGSGGSGGSTTGTGGSTSTGGSTGTGGSSGGAGGGSGGTTGGSGGTAGDAAMGGDTAGGETGGSATKLTLTVHDFVMNGDRVCFKPEAGDDGGNKSPRISWTGIPAAAKSLVLTTEDLSNTPTVHQIVCDIPVTVMDRPADVKGMLPPGASAGYGHNGKTAWYGPGANVRNYEIKVWALATEKLAGGCTGSTDAVRGIMRALKAKKDDKTLVLDSDGKVLWGSAAGPCR